MTNNALEYWFKTYPKSFVEKKCSDFGKKGPDCVNPWVESLIQNVVLRVSRRKSSEIFPVMPCAFD